MSSFIEDPKLSNFKSLCLFQFHNMFITLLTSTTVQQWTQSCPQRFWPIIVRSSACKINCFLRGTSFIRCCTDDTSASLTVSGFDISNAFHSTLQLYNAGRLGSDVVQSCLLFQWLLTIPTKLIVVIKFHILNSSPHEYVHILVSIIHSLLPNIPLS